MLHSHYQAMQANTLSFIETATQLHILAPRLPHHVGLHISILPIQCMLMLYISSVAAVSVIVGLLLSVIGASKGSITHCSSPEFHLLRFILQYIRVHKNEVISVVANRHTATSCSFAAKH